MSKKILIIDDDVELCEETAEILKDDGHFVQVAFDGKRGYDYIRKNIYDVVILDYRMAGLNGIEFLKRIRDCNLKTKIFLVTGKPFIEKLLAEERLSGLVAGFMNKPFEAETLLEKINS
ncbi:MAG: response regulator [Candidatus Omnitrophota bacterium]|jgi:DNA-binding NtrC family response regulator